MILTIYFYLIVQNNNIFHQKMNNSILLACLLCSLSFAFAIDPPLWPKRFTQDFVQGDSKTRVYTTGKIWYDINNDRQRCDVKNDYFDLLCSSVGSGTNTSCSQVIMNNNLYIWLQQKNLCCKCCTAQKGCKITPRDWLKQFKFVGQEKLSGESFYKWTSHDMPTNESYYASQSQQRIPRRIETGTYGVDFVMNTYSQEAISDQLFKLPKQCERDCPKTSFCSNFASNQEKDTNEYRGILAIISKKLYKNIKLRGQ